MFSVTARVKNVRQPRRGYIPICKLKTTEYSDEYRIETIDSYYKPIQGMAVDYLTRFMNGSPKQIAFQIPLMGAQKVHELYKAQNLLDKIIGLDEKSIYATCQLVGYDVVVRRGSQYFTSVENITPNKRVIHNIAVLVSRGISFFKKNGPIISMGFTFEGGYNDIICKGDGDYLTATTLWDLKVSESKPKITQTLQVLVYYILGIHSIHPEFQTIKELGIYNPTLNIAYTICLSKIPDTVFYNVSRDVIGYCMPENIEHWKNATGTNEKVKKETKELIINEFKDTGFSPDTYPNGIHDISIDDYWSYYRKIIVPIEHVSVDAYLQLYRPKFVHTRTVKLIKNSGFIMFVSISTYGTTCILQGGTLRELKEPLQYYYDKLPQYANAVLNKFSKYWETLYSISKQIQSINSNCKELKDSYKKYVVDCKKQNRLTKSYEAWCKLYSDQYSFSGEVHGCIIDIDYWNHIYLNPYDGSITPYFAASMYMKRVYKNLPSLISAQRPEMLSAFKHTLENSTDKKSAALILATSPEKETLSNLEQHEIDNSVLVTDTDMYYVSNRMKQLQKIYDYHLIVVWYDNILPNQE